MTLWLFIAATVALVALERLTRPKPPGDREHPSTRPPS